jgi:signal transduction histidine kinase
MVRFVVADTGRGIPEGQRDAIFQPFVQVEKGLTRSADGSGLGLAVGRELAERMGGTLTVTSQEGSGIALRAGASASAGGGCRTGLRRD